MSGLRFADPLWLLAVPLAAALLWWSVGRRRRDAVVFSSAELVRGLPRSWRQRWKAWLPALEMCGLALLGAALARPQLGREEFRVRREGVAILVALDRSNSMAAMDFQLAGQRVTRLEAAKHALREFVAGAAATDLAGRPDDLIGLVTFGGFAESRAPLTFDHQMLLQVVGGVELPIEREAAAAGAGQRGDAALLEQEGATAIGDALALGVERLRHTAAKSRVLILLSDGENTAGVLEPPDAARIAAAEGVKVYTIGIGSTGSAPFRVRDEFGRMRSFDQPVTLDEQTLRAVAAATGGQYFNARDTRSLQEVYGVIDRLEKTEIEGGVYTSYSERFALLLLPACALLALAMLLEATYLRGLSEIP